MENDKFGLPQRCGASQTAVSPRCGSSLTRLYRKIESAHVSRTVSWSATFLLILASLTIGGCGVTVPGVSSKTSTAGSLSVSSSSLLFGSVTVGNSAAETVTVTNTGTASIQVSQAQVTGQYFSLTGAAVPLTLAAGSSATLTVNFTPKAAGAAAGTLALTTPNSTTSIGLSGNGTISEQPGLTLSTTSVDFGTATINTAVTASVTMTSSGTAPLTISSATATGSGFSLSGLALPVTLSPGQSASLTLSFDPANAGSFSGAVTLATNTSQGTATIQMSGTGSTIQSILGDFTCDSDNLSGQGTENCSITLSSPAGTGGVTIGLASSSTSVIVPGQMTVAAGTSSGTFTLSYYPVATAQTVTLTASTTNSHKQHNLNVGSSSSPGLKINPTSVSFGNVMVNSTASQSVAVTSSGTSALTISAATVTGIGYGISGMALPLTLNPGQTANLTVSFDPSVAGSATGLVTLTTNASTASVALSGTGQTAGTLSALSCASSSMNGAGSDACTVSLTAAAPSGGLAVALSSNSSAVAVPSSVVVPAGATSVGFTATVASVTTAQTATLTAQSGGVTATYAINLAATATPVLSGVSCASGSMTGAGSDACTVALTVAAGSGGISVALSSSSSAVAVPASVLVPAGATSIGFAATVSSVSTTQTATLTAQAGGVTKTYLINLAPAVTPALSGVSCASSSMTSAGNDACTVSLTAAAGSGGVSVSLSSSSSAVGVPASVLVPAGANSVGFSAVVSSVTTAQTAIVTAQAGGVTKTYTINLGPGVPGLTLGSTSIAFGNVNLNSTVTQPPVVLTSSGTAPLTISAASVTGAGFTISGLTLPVTLNPGQTASLSISFNPTTSGSVTGAVTLTTNASPSTATIALSGTGAAASYQVDLTWSAPSSSPDPVAGYNIYRAVSGSSNYQLLNSGVNTPTTYTDSSVVNGTSYTYYVTSVDASGNTSAPSNTYSVAIP